MLAGADVLRPLEHHVLEQVSEPGAALALILRAHPIADCDGIDGGVVILGDDDAQPIGQAAICEADRLKRGLRDGGDAQQPHTHEGREETAHAHGRPRDGNGSPAGDPMEVAGSLSHRRDRCTSIDGNVWPEFPSPGGYNPPRTYPFSQRTHR